MFESQKRIVCLTLFRGDVAVATLFLAWKKIYQIMKQTTKGGGERKKNVVLCVIETILWQIPSRILSIWQLTAKTNIKRLRQK